MQQEQIPECREVQKIALRFPLVAEQPKLDRREHVRRGPCRSDLGEDGGILLQAPALLMKIRELGHPRVEQQIEVLAHLAEVSAQAQ